jgi:phosphogluconate dehydratase
MTPPLSVLQNRGLRVALVTDGRMSGASGKVPAAIHVTPEAADGGAIAKIKNGDLIRIDADAGTLEVIVAAAEWEKRKPASADLSAKQAGVGRELFACFRQLAGRADEGGSIFGATS